MKILLHCGVGNTDRPNRWRAINKIFTDMGESLIKLGHTVDMIIHPEAKIPKNDNTEINVQIVKSIELLNSINPDIAITWNGNSDGDRKFIDIVGRDKMIFGELGFFSHYQQTCYFDRCGVNTRHSIIGKPFSSTYISPDDEKILNNLINFYIKDRLIDEQFIFVPLQDETDTQITQFSPFKTMDEFIHNVFDIFRFDNRLIVYKQHPKAPSKITLRHPRVISVTGDVHHYLPYADLVFGLNSTVMVETLLYHGNLVNYGAGVAARGFTTEVQRQSYIVDLYKRQMKWEDLSNPDIVEKSHLYKLIVG